MKIRGQRVIPFEERIKNGSHIDPVSGCWIWFKTVKSNKAPYGRLIIGSRSDGTRRSVGAHQLSYMTFKGPILNAMCVCHTCDTPRCVNPEHLFLGTKKDNAHDRDRKGRNRPAPKIARNNNPQAKLSEQDLIAILASELSSRKISALYNVDASHIRALRRKYRAVSSLLPDPPAPSPALQTGEAE